jgi:GT2 family glycosyltransferase
MSAPEISVIVPVYRQWELVPALLECLTAQSLGPGRFEILLVNNAAPEAPPALALPSNARILPGPVPGSYAARNAGAAAARGRWLVFTDADCLPDPGWLAAMIAALEARPGALVAGPVQMIAPDDPNAYASYDLVRGIPQARYIARGYAATASLAVEREAFRALGGFDAARRSGGDAEFCRRAGAAGHGLVLAPDAVVRHPCREDWEALATKARRIKGGQISAGPLPRRIAWSMRTLSPPVRDTLAYLRAPHPATARAAAVAVRFRLWGVELAEMARLLAGGTPERR